MRRAFGLRVLPWHLCSSGGGGDGWGESTKKKKKAIRCNPWLQSCQTLFGTQAFIRCIDKYEYLLPERDFEGKRPKLSVHDITASLAVIRDDDVDR